MDYVTIKVTPEARRLLRLIAAQTGEQMAQEAERIFAAEWQRIKPNGQKPALPHQDAEK